MSAEEKEFEDVAARMFNSPDGKYLLDELEKRLGHRLFNADALVMAHRVGQFELIGYLRSFK